MQRRFLLLFAEKCEELLKALHSVSAKNNTAIDFVSEIILSDSLILLTLLHLERPKLYAVLAFKSEKGLSWRMLWNTRARQFVIYFPPRFYVKNQETDSLKSLLARVVLMECCVIFAQTQDMQRR